MNPANNIAQLYLQAWADMLKWQQNTKEILLSNVSQIQAHQNEIDQLRTTVSTVQTELTQQRALNMRSLKLITEIRNRKEQLVEDYDNAVFEREVSEFTLSQYKDENAELHKKIRELEDDDTTSVS